MRAFSWPDVMGELKFYEPAATLVLMYLAIMKTDYPYNIANEFKDGLIRENGWSEEQLKLLNCLREEDQIRPLLEKMEKKDLVKSAKEPSGRRRRHFSLNSEIVCSPWANEGYRNMLHNLSKSTGTPINEGRDNETVANFLKESGRNELNHYFRIWSEREKFDYLAFIGFLKDEASERENEVMVNLIKINIHEFLETKKAARQMKSDFEITEKIRAENKARKIKDELNPLDGMLDRIEKEW